MIVAAPVAKPRPKIGVASIQVLDHSRRTLAVPRLGAGAEAERQALRLKVPNAAALSLPLYRCRFIVGALPLGLTGRRSSALAAASEPLRSRRHLVRLLSRDGYLVLGGGTPSAGATSTYVVLR